ncbi:FtsQ-type POTRA domain-containing protein [Patescibacteria group bacterium]|nr:FtsQ-type POTRA domain-containing protein [Patescibacteria group bacterium]
MITGKFNQNIQRRVKKTKSIKKDYQQKSLNNPFFRSRQKKSPTHKLRRGFLLFFIILLLIVAGLFYFFFISSVFSLQKIQVDGLTRISSEKLVALAWAESEGSKLFVFKRSNIFFFEVNELHKELNKNFSFANVEIKKKWPNTLLINVEERALAFIWQNATGKSFSDSKGCLIPEVQPSVEDEKLYPVLIPGIEENYIKGDNCLKVDDGYLTSMLNLDVQLKVYENLAVQNYVLETEFNTLTIDLLDGPNVYFNIKNDLEKQVKKLAIIKREKPEAEFKLLSYIDLRYGDRVYFK